MGTYNFDEIIDRRNTSSLKWDFGMQRMGRDDLLPLWVADMDFRLPEEVIEDLVKRAEHGVFGYTDPSEEYLLSVRNWYKRRHNADINCEDITVVPGVVYSIALAIKAFTKPGEAVIIQQPVYYPFHETIRDNGRKLINNQLLYKDGHYEIDFEDFEKKIIENDVKLFLLCSPHNPVGRVWKNAELTRLADICIKHDVYIFADEIHSDFVYPGYKHTSLLTFDDEYKKKLIVGTSASKTFNLAGLQVANIIIPDKETKRLFRKENDAAGYSQLNAMGMVATQSVYEKGERWLDELIVYLEGNLSYIRNFLKENLPKVKLIDPEGTYLIWLDFSEVTDDYHKLKEIIVDKAKLWLDAGIIFGKETALFERINIACPRAIIEDAMNRLKEAMED